MSMMRTTGHDFASARSRRRSLLPPFRRLRDIQCADARSAVHHEHRLTLHVTTNLCLNDIRRRPAAGRSGEVAHYAVPHGHAYSA